MGHTYLPRAMTAPELEYIRRDDQSSMLYMAVYKPPVVYSARINQVFTTFDKVIQLTYDSGSGTLADVLPNMTMYVGTSAGASDVGIVRVRKTPTGTIFYIGENSEIVWADNLYLTVVDDFGLWARHISIASNVPFMDYDVAYSDQHTATVPIPILGPRFVPVFLSAATVVVPFNASLSYTLTGTIADYSWDAPGASATSGLTTATPIITYNATGTYRVACTITGSNGKITTGYVYVRVFNLITDPPITQFDLKSCTGSSSDGGWKLQISMWDEATLADVIDRAMVVLFARDFYGTTEVSIGQIANRENIVFTGWISGESIVEDPDGSNVEFTVDTANAWMKKISGFPVGIQNVTIAPTAWTSWLGLTVDASLYHLFYWQSTIIPTIDVFLTNDTKVSAEQYAPGDTTLGDQMIYLLKNTLLGTWGCDRFNRLFCEVDTQITPPAERSSFPVVLDLLKTDWLDQLPISRMVTNTTSQVNLSGVIIAPPAAPVPVFSLAPGHVYTSFGRPVRQDRMLLASQSAANQLAAMKLAWDNHNLEFSPDLAGNNRMLDVFPSHQYVGVVVAESDTPRGFTFDGNMIVREINVSFNQKEDSGFLQISWMGEQEVFPGNSTDGDLPAVSDVPAYSFPPTPPTPTIPLTPYIAVAPPDPSTVANVIILVHGVGVYYTTNFSGPGTVRWYAMNSGLTSGFPEQIVNIEVAAGGRCWCQVGNDSVWSAAAPGQPWSKVFDYTMIGNPEGYPFPRGQMIYAFGINRDADDEVLIMGSLTVTIGSNGLHYNWWGGSGGVTRQNATFWNVGTWAITGNSNITYGDGAWTISYPTGLSPKYQNLAVFSGHGGILVGNTAFSAGIEATRHTRARYAPSAIMVRNNSPFQISTDNGANFTALTSAPSPYEDLQSFCTNTTGEKILIGTSSVGLRRSSDYGATWGATSTLASIPSVWNLGTDSDWIFTFISEVLYTPDFGNTFIYRTGDLKTWVGPTASISAIRYY